jgi:cysteine-rich repeat protein
MRVAQTSPTTTTVQLLGKAGEYQIARKLYLSSVQGFGNLAATASDPNITDEVTLATDEATPSFMNPIMTGNDFFTLGAQSPAGTDNQFCEDVNEQSICGASSNSNGCTASHLAAFPFAATANTVCGNGTREAYEECDDGTNNGVSGDHCSATCRCVFDFNEATGVCN